MTDYEQSENQLQQALAMNQMLLDTLEKEREDRRKTRKISIICACVCVVSLLLFAGVLGVLASGIQIERTSTETTQTQTVEGDSAIIANENFEQYNDNAVNGVVNNG